MQIISNTSGGRSNDNYQVERIPTRAFFVDLLWTVSVRIWSPSPLWSHMEAANRRSVTSVRCKVRIIAHAMSVHLRAPSCMLYDDDLRFMYDDDDDDDYECCAVMAAMGDADEGV